MNKNILIILCSLVFVAGVVLVPFPDGLVGLAAASVVAAIFIVVFRAYTEEKSFVTEVFLLALAVRIAFGIMVHVFDLRDFFGGDANTYDSAAASLADVWLGGGRVSGLLLYQTDAASGVGWGMVYFVASIYVAVGRNIFAAQSVVAVIGAATAPMVYSCSIAIYENKRVARLAAWSIALFPPFVIWTGQLLKDGLILFLLVMTMTMVVQLHQKFSYKQVIVLVLGLVGIFALRFYIFFPAVVAIAGSFFIGVGKSSKSLIQRSLIVVFVGFAMSYLGINQMATEQLSTFGNLERIQLSRLDLSRAGSGFGEDADTSTSGGALAQLPIGFAYLMFAPFPWQATNLRQGITIPDVLAWWGLMPLMVSGFIFTMRQKFRPALPVIIFTALLTLAYSVSQGNVGTAYRQRTQIQVFFFMFIAVGWALYKERRENKKLIAAATSQSKYEKIRAARSAT